MGFQLNNSFCFCSAKGCSTEMEFTVRAYKNSGVYVFINANSKFHLSELELVQLVNAINKGDSSFTTKHGYMLVWYIPGSHAKLIRKDDRLVNFI
jgi:hypothetical protein